MRASTVTIKSEQDIEKLKNEIEKRKNALSGATVEVNPTSSVVSTPELTLSGAGN